MFIEIETNEIKNVLLNILNIDYLQRFDWMKPDNENEKKVHGILIHQHNERLKIGFDTEKEADDYFYFLKGKLLDCNV